MIGTSLSADTEVVLMLCGRFGGERQESHAPLSTGEYARLAQWLNDRGLHPADLTTTNGRRHLGELNVPKLDAARIEFLLGRGTALALALERWNRSGLWVISRGDPAFPRRLKRRLRHAAPPLLYGAGSKDLLECGGLAIVGSRDATPTALDYTSELAAQCAREGVAVISGGARGVDAAAMQGATTAGGNVIGVLASDLLKASVHRQNRPGLRNGQLVLVSPYHPEAGFNAGNAMGRNRYIYALADSALVIDSALGSGGTWAGAVEALKAQWVPVHVRMPGEGPGNAALVDKGALPFDYEPGSDPALADALRANEGTTTREDGKGSVQASLLEARPGASPATLGTGAPANASERQGEFSSEAEARPAEKLRRRRC